MIEDPADRIGTTIGTSQIPKTEPGCSLRGTVVETQVAERLQGVKKMVPQPEFLEKSPG